MPPFILGNAPMHITLPPELESFVHSQVADGTFISANDVIHTALRLLQEPPGKPYRLPTSNNNCKSASMTSRKDATPPTPPPKT